MRSAHSHYKIKKGSKHSLSLTHKRSKVQTIRWLRSVGLYWAESKSDLLAQFGIVAWIAYLGVFIFIFIMYIRSYFISYLAHIWLLLLLNMLWNYNCVLRSIDGIYLLIRFQALFQRNNYPLSISYKYRWFTLEENQLNIHIYIISYFNFWILKVLV